MIKRINHKCPVCDEGKSKLIYSPWVKEDDPKKLYGAASGVPGTQFIVKCETCSMIYESPRYEKEIIIDGYKSSVEENHDTQYEMRVKSFYKALKKNSNFVPKPGSKVLDIGTAGGAFLEAAQKYGYDVYGMEPSYDLVKRGKARGLNIEQGTVENHSFQLGSFDMVCLWDVIEHIPDPKAALIEVRKLLKSDGILLINYPDIGTVQAKLAGKRFWWILSVHLHHFTRDSISEICKRAGFEVFHFQRYWQMLEFGYLEQMATLYKVPFAGFITRITPDFIKRIPIPYYASQTTTLAKVKK
jgi:2-polyprenyl-3-methyl-5-hydroxy-6-metoxy-1,4-benzoquinol methylase